MGYTPLFDTLTEGTLCGRWPDIGLWPIMLSMADWRGHVDKTPQFISMVSGLPLPEVQACIARFCAPDPDSRSRDEGGARLVLIDPERSWGWRVVNIQVYRDKASDQKQISDGRNAAKVRRYKERHRKQKEDTGKTPEDTGGHRSTLNTYSNTNKEEEYISTAAQSRVPSRHVDLVFEHWQKTFGHTDAKLTPKRRRLIAARLKDFPVERLTDALDGYKRSPFHMGDNERQTVYDSIELFLRDAEHVEKGLALISRQNVQPLRPYL